MSELDFRLQDDVAILTMSRPQARNALNEAMRESLEEALGRIDADSSIRAVILTGAGGAFSAGGDVRALGASDFEQSLDGRRLRMQRHHRVVKLLLGLDRPVIAAVDGAAFGAGFSLALMCDFMVATPRARFCMAFGRIGLIPDYGALYTLPRWVGLPRAKELMFSAREVSAQEALTLGLVLELVEPEALMDRAMVYAQSFCGASPQALPMTKAALNRSMSSDLNTMLDLEAWGQPLAGLSDYSKETVQGFAQKIPPRLRWPGPDKS